MLRGQLMRAEQAPQHHRSPHTKGGAPSMVAPVCTLASTARSKPERSACIMPPAALLSESSG